MVVDARGEKRREEKPQLQRPLFSQSCESTLLFMRIFKQFAEETVSYE